MNNPLNDRILSAPLTRRQFLATSTKAAATATLAGALPRPGYTAEDNTIKIVLVGCGGRGTGAAAQALSTQDRPSSGPWLISLTTACRTASAC